MTFQWLQRQAEINTLQDIFQVRLNMFGICTQLKDYCSKYEKYVHLLSCQDLEVKTDTTRMFEHCVWSWCQQAVNLAQDKVWMQGKTVCLAMSDYYEKSTFLPFKSRLLNLFKGGRDSCWGGGACFPHFYRFVRCREHTWVFLSSYYQSLEIQMRKKRSWGKFVRLIWDSLSYYRPSVSTVLSNQ